MKGYKTPRVAYLSVLGMSFTNLVLFLVGEHFSDGNRLAAGQLLEIISLDVHLAFTDSLGKGYHAI